MIESLSAMQVLSSGKLDVNFSGVTKLAQPSFALGARKLETLERTRAGRTPGSMIIGRTKDDESRVQDQTVSFWKRVGLMRSESNAREH